MIEKLIKEVEKSVEQYKGDGVKTYLDYLKKKGLKGDELAITLANDMLESAKISAIGAVTTIMIIKKEET